ncbi:C4-dicarboxylate ABC transporter permease [Marivirga lumbricoides]|uniref:C4-dicarboxylate ABC transporter permease n=1 Tax=Marivirga lumbricoides TaxID=1046115 RepID=A0ABQ1N2A2_9BACT|nr:C4-dicarboxylate ABC transporter permease [Marivirga lumbricoides]
MRVKLDTFLEWILAILLAIMTLDVLWGVFTRYVMNSQSSWTDELARFLLIWISILGAAYASGKRLHISIDLISSHLSDKNKKKLYIFVSLVILLFVLLVFVLGGLWYVYIAFKLGQLSPALQLPMGCVYSVLPIAGLFIAYYKLTDLYCLFINTQSVNEWK